MKRENSRWSATIGWDFRFWQILKRNEFLYCITLVRLLYLLLEYSSESLTLIRLNLNPIILLHLSIISYHVSLNQSETLEIKMIAIIPLRKEQKKRPKKPF